MDIAVDSETVQMILFSSSWSLQILQAGCNIRLHGVV